MAVNLEFVEYIVENIADSGKVRHNQKFSRISIR